MDTRDLLTVLRKYKKCPGCGCSNKDNKFKVSLKSEIITLDCKCGYYKKVDKNNKEIK